jgi:hypothetical protein
MQWVFHYKFYYICFMRFRANVLAENHLLFWERTMFDNVWRTSDFFARVYDSDIIREY